jgi:hypothetical protein
MHHDFDPKRFIAATPHTERGYASFLGTQLEDPGVVTLVAERDGEVIGYGYVGVEGHDYMSLRGPAEACCTTWWWTARATMAAGSSSRARPADLVAARSTLTGEHLAAFVGSGPKAVPARGREPAGRGRAARVHAEGDDVPRADRDEDGDGRGSRRRRRSASRNVEQVG